MHDPVLLGLGANVGDAMVQLAAAVELIGEIDGVEVTDVSSVYATPPWPPPGDPRHVPQDEYRNLVVRARASIGPEARLAATLELERLLGRDRSREQRWGPRPIDIDLLLLGDLAYESERLTLPHEQATSRRFVLIPLLELDFDLQAPDGTRLSEAFEELGFEEGVRREGDPLTVAGPAA